MQLDEKILKELEVLMKEYGDEEIREMLKKRNLYNPDVAQMAVAEALQRGIIHSEQDLVAREYRIQKLRFRLFPDIENEEIKERLIRSLSRGVLLTGVFPVIYGFLKIAENKWPEALLLIIPGAIWIVSMGLLMHKYNRKLISIILGMAGMSEFYVVNLLLHVKLLQFMDLFVAVVVYGIIFYSLLYIRSLCNHKNPE
jgi:hypothetical protein